MALTKMQQYMADRLKLLQIVNDPSKPQDVRNTAKAALDKTDVLLGLTGALERKQAAQQPQQQGPEGQPEEPGQPLETLPQSSEV